MTELTIKQLNAIGNHLKKVEEIYQQNLEGGLHLKMPDKIWLNQYTDGQPLGSIEFSEDEGEHVFVPFVKREAPSWSGIPIPPPPPPFE